MSDAALPLNAACPRCGGPFRCGVADKTCACFGLNIGPVLRAQLAAEYSECLCVKCLAELQALHQANRPSATSKA